MNGYEFLQAASGNGNGIVHVIIRAGPGYLVTTCIEREIVLPSSNSHIPRRSFVTNFGPKELLF